MLFDRTFHPDEANQAFTVGRLLETGTYTYKPTDHHGPTLYYAAVPLQKAFGHATTATLDGTLLRCTPLLFGVLALAVLAQAVYGLIRHLRDDARNGERLLPALAAAAAVLLLGTSPLFVFYATDFIQETLLACFTAMMLNSAVGYAIARSPEPPDRPRRLKPGTWALFFGFSAGLCFATKETCVLTFAAAALAAAPVLILQARRHGFSVLARLIRPNDAVLVFLAFLLTSVVLFSSFCQDWTGVYNAFVAAPLSYFHRAAGDATAGGADWHVHPWWQYLQWLFFGDTAFANRHLLIQWLILLIPAILSRLGLIHARPSPRQTIPFLCASVYFIALLALYSAIPYKTPWCAVQIFLGFVFAVSMGYATIADMLGNAVQFRRRSVALICKLAILVLLPAFAILGEHIPGLLRISRDPDSRDIPYNYAHASPEVKDLAACVDTAMKSADSRTSFLAVSLPPEDTWPFPWYNRAWEPKTGYWTKFEDLVELEKTGARPTVVIVPMREGHLVQPLFPHLKHTKRFYMRPGVRVRVFW